MREGEIIQRIVKRHWTPFILKAAGIIFIAIPFYIVIYFFGRAIEGDWVYAAYAILSFFIGAAAALMSFDYLLDKLVITNKRVIWINWKSPIKKEEHETELLDIQDIETKEKGVLSKLRIFDYGLLEIETSATKTCITYTDCPDPIGLKHFLILEISKRRSQVFGKGKSQNTEEFGIN